MPKVIHADIDPAEIGKNRAVDVPIVGDIREVLVELVATLRSDSDSGSLSAPAAWVSQLDEIRDEYPLGYGPQSDGSLSPEYVIERLSVAAGPDAIYCAGVGQHQMWVAQHCRFNHPRNHLTSGALGTMGFGLPAAMGAQFACPERTVVLVSGDGSFMMNVQELATIARCRLPVKIVLLDNSSLGMVRQWQELFFAERYSEIDLSD
ncbi:thiamine pyrophosphate-dependent enzyme, partial [Acinetobacter baumannii]|uniref:thiamine pyrophosphate-dependent enzyme n=1 Tax=Acinetobacter baumannii TaxID=470 RepID=UPI0020903D56